MSEEVQTHIPLSVAEELAIELGYEFFPVLKDIDPPKDLVEGDFSKLLGSWAKHNAVIPISESESYVEVAVCDPTNIEAIDVVRYCYGKDVKIVVAPESEILSAINGVRTTLMKDRDSSLEANEEGESDISQSLKIDVTDSEDDDAPIIRYVNTLIFKAASSGASDIHIEPSETGLKVRFRIDGVLQDISTEDKSFQSAILSRVKVMAHLNIAEKRLPQDGRIGIKIAGQDVDIRVSTVPTRYGERIVMRLLDKSKVMLDLSSIGLSEENANIIRENIVKNHGIILLTGPTGSGKTTTLYASLSQINSKDKNILTVEDPIEYELDGIGQMQVNPKIDFTFASGLRSILRQDPDVIMVGEIRDLETVEIAIQASLTGHLVFSTLHTNDAPGAITRLLDMGVEPFLISSSLLLVIAQRLVRRLCPNCKEKKILTQAELEVLKLGHLDPHTLDTYTNSSQGCEECQFNGFKGRSGIHELLLITDEVKEQIMLRSNATKIRAAAKSLKSLREDGATKIIRGETSFEEVIRVTQEEILI